MPRAFLSASVVLAAVIVGPLARAQSIPALPLETGWPTYGGDAGGQRYSPSAQITPSNVATLTEAWHIHTHALDADRPGRMEASFEATPVLLGHTLFLITPFDKVFALDAATGRELWHFDPEIRLWRPGQLVTARAVALWPASATQPDLLHPCATRVLFGTLDARLIALDAATGQPCSGFGHAGIVDLRGGVHLTSNTSYGMTSPPTVLAAPDFYGGLRPGDNRDADSLVALDAKTGRKAWAFQTVHHNLWDYDVAAEPLLFTFRGVTPAVAVATKSAQIFVLDRRTGQPLLPVIERPVPQQGAPGDPLSPTQPLSTVDPLSPLTLPSGSSALDGWQRSARNAAYCRKQLQALRYDGLYTPPTLQGSLLFPSSLGGVNWGSAAFDPATGVLYANTNRYALSIRLVPRHGFEATWRLHLEPVVRDWWFWIVLSGVTVVILCIARHSVRLRRSDLLLALAVAAVSILTVLFPWNPDPAEGHFSQELSPQQGTPYLIERKPILDRDGNSCVPPPWATLSAVDLNTGGQAFSVPLGIDAQGHHVGTLTLGGPIVTGGGLVFDAATLDARLRAFDSASGKELWSAQLPAPAQSTPMTYTLNGRQYLVIAAGGHTQFGTLRGDDLIAYALP